MKIVNNKIEITRGETPTYDVAVIDENGVPLMIPFRVDSDGISRTINNPMIEFIVRPSVYDRECEFVFRALLDYNDIHKFESLKVEDYNLAMSTDFDEYGDPIPAENPLWVPEDETRTFKRGSLYRREYKGEVDYRYYDEEQVYIEEGVSTNHWIPYEFRITFMFPYESTVKMEAKTYSYGIVLYGGNKKSEEVYDKIIFNADDFPIDIDYMKPLISSEEFIVGGTPNVWGKQ